MGETHKSIRKKKKGKMRAETGIIHVIIITITIRMRKPLNRFKDTSKADAHAIVGIAARI